MSRKIKTRNTGSLSLSKARAREPKPTGITRIHWSPQFPKATPIGISVKFVLKKGCVNIGNDCIVYLADTQEIPCDTELILIIKVHNTLPYKTLFIQTDITCTVDMTIAT